MLAAQEVGPDVVRVVDSRGIAMGLGFAALRAAEAAHRGASVEEVERVAVETAERSETLFVVETLEHLRRGGRIGHAAALLGTALAVKPVLRMVDGEIRPLEKVRTMQRAMNRLVELVAEAAGDGEVSLAVHHLASPDRAAELATRLDERLGKSSGCVVSELGAVVGAHTGPGVLGVVVQRPTPMDEPPCRPVGIVGVRTVPVVGELSTLLGLSTAATESTHGDGRDRRSVESVFETARTTARLSG